MYDEMIYRPAGRPNELFTVESTGITYCNETYDVKRTRSSMYIFEYIYKGKGTVKVNDVVFHPEEGDVYILPKNSNHHYFSDAVEPWEKIWITIDGSLIETLLISYGLKNIYYIPAFHKPDIFKAFLEGVKERSFDLGDKRVVLFHELCIDLARGLKTKKKSISPVAKSIRDYLDANFEQHVNLKDLSSYIYKSPSQIIRIFKNAYGVTPYQYVVEERIKTAKMLLRNHDYLSIKEVAFKLNFSDEHYFSNFFKSKTGMSPVEYKKREAGF